MRAQRRQLEGTLNQRDASIRSATLSRVFH
jgi:hypothetical protein